MLRGIALILHLIAINIWVGGSFFAVVILGRAIKNVETHQQLTVWVLVLNRFFAWAWIAVAVLLGSGAWMIFFMYSGIENVPLHIQLMGIIALIMMGVFLFIFLVPFRQFKRLVPKGDVEACLKKLAIIRIASTINLILGFCIVIVIAAGPYFLY